MDISVVIPVFRGEESLLELIHRLHSVLQNLGESYEIILVDDGSPDESWKIVCSSATQNGQVRGVKLSRNFGQHAAITAGLAHSVGALVVIMDCDLQDQPEEIPKLIDKAKEGFDQVVAVRLNRQDPKLKRLFSWLFAVILSWLGGQKINHRVGNFGVYSRKVIDAIVQMPEQTRMFTLMSNWVGFNRAEVDVLHAPRIHGKTTYSMRKLISLGVSSVISHSDRPLKLNVLIGLTMSFLSFSYAVFMIVQNLIWGVTVLGWTSLMVVVIFSTGLLMQTVGIVGLYVGRIFTETKRRPIYLVDQVVNYQRQD